MRNKMRRRRRELSIPILSYYLTFIHYFGFSINQNIRNLKSPHNPSTTRQATTSNSLTTNQAKVLTASPKSTIIYNRKASKSKVEMDHFDSKWFARHRLHDSIQTQQPVQATFEESVGIILKKGVKFIAISFTTFLALNHCAVLVDYIYQGTMRFEELMFDFRLVITKISALIFVLSWHFNQSKVDKLIALVKSTSIYILSTQNSNQEMNERNFSKRFSERALSGSNLATNTQSSSDNHLRQNPRSWARDQNGQRSFNEAFGELTRAQFETITKFNISDKKEKKMDEDRELHSFTVKVSERILRWWLMCICITVVHFSLSEAEIFKSQHLWTWLDDYSIHQLSNKTTSLTTLMFLASFDNYIYTVHVYGARLIGASIICIVCSLQRESIDSLRFQALRMLRVSSLYGARHISKKGDNNINKRLEKNITNIKVVENNLVSRQQTLLSESDQKLENNIVTSKGIKLAGLSCSGLGDNLCSLEGGVNFILPYLNSKNIDSRFAQQTSNSRIDHEKEKKKERENNNGDAIHTSNNNINNKVCKTINYELDDNTNNYSDHNDDEVSYNTNRDLFFVLGESDWLKLQDNLDRLRPRGYLSLPLWKARKYLCSSLSQLIFGLVNLKKVNFEEKLSKNRISCSRNSIMALKENGFMKDRLVNLAVTCNLHRQEQPNWEPQQRKLKEREKEKACSRVTPTPTCLHPDIVNDKTELPNQINAPQVECSLMKSGGIFDELACFQTTPNDDVDINEEHDQLQHFCINNDLSQKAGEKMKTKATIAATMLTNHYPLFAKDSSLPSEVAVDKKKDEILCLVHNEQQQRQQQQNNLQALKDDNCPLGTTKQPTAETKTRSFNNTLKANSREQSFKAPVNVSKMIEWQLERLASKYELVRTVNSRIDSCFGPMLLIQYSFLFLMSCIDVVYFSICFNPNTKTKNIIISGMILLWWPYLLLYKFASDIGSSSKELLISVRRLARLSLVEHHQSTILALSKQQQQPLIQHNKKCQLNEASGSGVTCSPLATMTKYPYLNPPYINMNSKTADNFHLSTFNSLLDYNLKRRRLRFQSAGDKRSRKNNYYETTCRLSNLNSKNTHYLDNSSNSSNLNCLTSDNGTNKNCYFYPLPLQSPPSSSMSTLIGKTRARIINKLDHVFKPTNLSIIGIMTIDKFFLLNFAKIVITASVMIIQFIS